MNERPALLRSLPSIGPLLAQASQLERWTIAAQRWLIARGQGHAVVLEHYPHH